MSYSWFRRKKRERRRFASESSLNVVQGMSDSLRSAQSSRNDGYYDEFQELLITKQNEAGSPSKKTIARSKVGSVDNLAAFVAPSNRQHLSGRHVKYQTRQKIKAPHTNWVSINSHGVVCKVAADKRAITKAKELGVSTRELRMFDQVYGHFHNNTTRILVRENALVSTHQ